VFGSEHHTSILIHLLNAVLQLPAERRVVSVQILNPITEPVKLDDKLSILDIKACDQSGRYFNVEMQMVLHPALRSRFLYYWARSYSSQLVTGDAYERLAPVISICFLDGLLFPETDAYHLSFRLQDAGTGLVFGNDIALHIFQLPSFVKTQAEVRSELDCWLYLLNNGRVLDPDQLAEQLQFPEFQEALTILKTLTQDDILREHYEAREKARRDALSWQKTIERWQQEAERAQKDAERAQKDVERAQKDAERAVQDLERARQDLRLAQQQAEQAQQQAEQAQQQTEQAQQQAEQAQQQTEQAQQQAEQAQQQADQARQQAGQARQQAGQAQQQAGQARQQADQARQQADQLRQELTQSQARALSEGLIGQIRLCQQLLGRPEMLDERLRAMTAKELQQLAEQLRQELTS
jgi:predicted transposase/invertase (TIGR01784 family)